MRSAWQISGGSAARSYAEVFFRHGVGLIGPGDGGPWRAERIDDEFGGSHVRRFASEVEQDDVFLLRFGTSRIQAVGIVASDYLYLNQFDEVNGWDLQHARRVRWFRLPTEYDFGKPVFGANPWRFSKILHNVILNYVERFLNSPPLDWQMASLPPLPVEEEPLDEVPVHLQEIVAVAQDLGWNLYLDKQAFGDLPSEDEIIVHLVVPFLRALGWHPEQIAVKWRYTDVALFTSLPRTPANCHLVIEAKQLGAGVEGALRQAIGYVDTLGIQCDVMVTDGVRYRLYGAETGYSSIAYANLGRLKKSATELFARLKNP